MAATMASLVTGLPLPGSFMTALRDGLERLGEERLAPALDLTMTDRSMVATLAVPGVRHHTIAITVAEDHVKVSCSIRDSTELGGHEVHRELSHGALSRSFWLPARVVPAATRASLEDGLLTLTLRIADAAMPRSEDVLDLKVD